MLLSVVIPVYNAEKFLKATVDSVLAQISNDYEIILVDDGSTDKSAIMCDSLASQHPQIRVVHKPNGGVSSARNLGMDVAKGKYITFIDSDDKAGQNMFSDLLNECESKNADKVFCGFDEICENESHIIHIADLPPRQLLDRNYIVSSMLYLGCTTDSYMNSVWGSLYRAELIRKYNLRFEKRSMGEDWLFNMQYCDIIDSAVYVNEPYYKYMRNGESAMSRYHPRQFEFWIENRKFRKCLSDKYKFNIDQKLKDSEWVIKVLFYALQVIKFDTDSNTKLRDIFLNREFISALNNATCIRSKLFVPIVWLLKKKHIRTAIALLRIYSIRIN